MQNSVKASQREPEECEERICSKVGFKSKDEGVIDGETEDRDSDEV